MTAEEVSMYSCETTAHNPLYQGVVLQNNCKKNTDATGAIHNTGSMLDSNSTFY